MQTACIIELSPGEYARAESTRQRHGRSKIHCKAVPVYQYSCIRYISTDDLRITDLSDHACVNRQNSRSAAVPRRCSDCTRTSTPGASDVHRQGLRIVLVEKGCSRSVMLTAVRSQCLLAKTFMMIYAASSLYIQQHNNSLHAIGVQLDFVQLG